jgi:hypothetical protein
MKPIDFNQYRNQRFGILTFVKYSHFDGKRRYILVKCDCGVEKIVEWENLKKRMKSCGCKKKEVMLGRRHPLYGVWRDIQQRCYNPKQPSYKYYGGKGIVFSDSWTNYDNFYLDNIHRYKEGLEIDRYPDKNGIYSLENTRWVLHVENMRNTNRVKLSEEIAGDIRGSNESAKSLAQKYSVTTNTIWAVKRDKLWNPNL